MNESYKHMMNEVKLSDGARAAMEEKLQSASPAPRRRVRPLRTAVIAACVCFALAGTALAIELFPQLKLQKLDASPVDGSPANGFTTVIEYDGETVIEYPDAETVAKGDTTTNLLNENDLPVLKLKPAMFSQEVLDLTSQAVGSQFTYLEMQNFSNAEEYLGMEIFNNPLLESASIGRFFLSGDRSYNCLTTILGYDGELRAACVEASYYLNYQDVPDENGFTNSVPVMVDLRVQLYTTLSPIGISEMFGAYVFPEGYTFSGEEYVTPSGLEAMIITVYDTEGKASYYAQCGINGAAVTLHAAFYNDSELALSTLKDVLDAFEY